MEPFAHVQVLVRGNMQGQFVNNVFYYTGTSGSDTLTAWLTAFRTEWRTNIVANVSDEYEVLFYEAMQIGGVVWLNPDGTLFPPSSIPGGGWPDVTPVLRFTDRASLTGAGAADTGSITTQSFPSYVTVGFKKTCGNLTRPENTTPLLLGRSVRGGFRISGIPVISTDDGEANELNAAAITLWGGSGPNLRIVNSGSADAVMEVVSLFANKRPRIDPDPVLPESYDPFYARATVTAIALNPFLTSQTSRKQSSSNLG